MALLGTSVPLTPAVDAVLENGWQPAVVLGADVAPNKRGTGTILVIELGFQCGKTLKIYFNLTNPSEKCVELDMARLSRFATACGLVTALTDTTQLLGKKLDVLVESRRFAAYDSETGAVRKDADGSVKLADGHQINSNGFRALPVSGTNPVGQF